MSSANCLGWNSNRRDARRHIPDYDRSSANHACRAYKHALNNTRPSANMRSRLYPDSARKHCSRSNVNVGAHDAVVINNGSGIDYCVGSYFASRLKNGPRHNLDSIFNLHVPRHDRQRMYHSCEAISLPSEALVNIFAIGRRLGRPYTVHKLHVASRMKRNSIVVAEALDSEQRRGCWIQVNKSEYRPAA